VPATVDVFNPVPPASYVPVDLDTAIELARNGNAVFWKIIRHHADRVAPGFPIEGPPVAVAVYGIFAPGSNLTPPHAVFFGPPPNTAGLVMPGIPQHVPGSNGYPVVTKGSITFGGDLQFHLSE
jgi:hypothetical protein